MMKKMNLLGAVLLWTLVSTANAAVFTVNAGFAGENRGAFNSLDVVQALGDRWKVQDGSYQVRSIGTGGFGALEVSRNYHIFDIPALASNEVVTGVTFNVPHPGGANPSYQSPDSSELVGLFDIDPANFGSIRAASVVNDQRPGSVLQTIYGDLGSGTSYGTFSVSPANNGNVQSVNLPLLEAILTSFGQAGGGDFGIGGRLLSNTHGEANALERIWRASSAFPNLSSLVISTSITAVPIPAAVWLFGAGITGLAGIARRREAISA